MCLFQVYIIKNKYFNLWHSGSPHTHKPYHYYHQLAEGLVYGESCLFLLCTHTPYPQQPSCEIHSTSKYTWLCPVWAHFLYPALKCPALQSMSRPNTELHSVRQQIHTHTDQQCLWENCNYIGRHTFFSQCWVRCDMTHHCQVWSALLPESFWWCSATVFGTSVHRTLPTVSSTDVTIMGNGLLTFIFEAT